MSWAWVFIVARVVQFEMSWFRGTMPNAPLNTKMRDSCFFKVTARSLRSTSSSSHT